MKFSQLIFVPIVLFSTSVALGQCDAPIVLDWTAVNDTTFTIVFESSVNGEYQVESYSEHTFGGGYFQETGPVVNGINTITVIFDEGDAMFYPDLIFYTTWINLICGPGIYSEDAEFYMSSRTLRNNEGFTCSNLLTPMIDFLQSPDSFDIPINISLNESIESVSVFMDFGLSNGGWPNVTFSLVHPNGNVVMIFDETVPYASMSVVFSDYAAQTFEYTPGEDYIGYFQPSEPLAELTGLPAQGEWKLRVQHQFFLPSDEFIYGLCLNINESNCIASLEGEVFFDLNGNGIYDNQEPPMSEAYVQNSADDYTFYTTSQGQYWQCSPAGEGNLSVLNIPEYYEANSLNFSLDSGEYAIDQNIAITAATSATDLSVDLFSWDANRPGFSATYHVVVDNIGTLCADEVELSIAFPSYVQITDSEMPELTISGNSASLDMIELCPFESLEFEVEILLDDTVSLGTILEATVNVNTSETDADPNNNTFTSAVEVVGSYDPNDKQVSATTIGDEFLEDGAPLKYTIRFQNTGTFYAERVVIVDTIDADLDLNSLQIISTSHNMQLVREGNVVFFGFDQIFLPDSATDFDGSIGHVRYEITPFPTFSEGQTIDNTAYIYFDFNEPIVTNTVVTEFGNPLSISNEIEFETRLFPNPANQNITISWAQDVEVDRIEIYDLSGRLLKSQNISAENIYLLEVSDLSDGMYLINLVAGTLQSRQKFMKLAER
jgi:uncharacterized repeat protein (TIGR01451 family)